jgi:hypothetical protein
MACAAAAAAAAIAPFSTASAGREFPRGWSEITLPGV